MAEIKTEHGDLTTLRPNKRSCIVCHLCNNGGTWSGSFAKSLDRLSPVPKQAYLAYAKAGQSILGNAQLVEILPGFYVAHLIAQSKQGVDYTALERSLKITMLRALRLGAEIHIPAGLGSGKAGGDRQKIHALIKTVAEGVEKGKFAMAWAAHNQPLILNIVLWDLPAAGTPTPDPGTKPAAVVAADMDDEC